MRYKTTRDIVIPAGTELSQPPSASTRWGRDFEAVIADGKDNVVYLTADITEGIASGLIVAEES